MPTERIKFTATPQVSGASGVFGTSGTTVTVTWTTPTTITVATQDAPSGGWTESQIDAATVSMVGTSDSDDVKVYEVYYDVTYVTQPVVNVTAPTGTLVQENVATATWENTLDSDGGAQTFYEVKIFTDAVVSGGGFNANTSTAADGSGVVAGAALTWTGSVRLGNGNYHAYVRVAQTVNGTAHWSAWDSSPFTVNVTPPAVPSVNATGDDANARISLAITEGVSTGTSVDNFEVQRSADAGVTWEEFRTLEGDGYATPSGGSVTVYDYEAANGETMTYRARAIHDYGGGLIVTSDWSTTDADDWSGTQWWLKHPRQPSLNMNLVIDSNPGEQRPARQSINQPLGASKPIVVSDLRGSSRGTLRVRLDTEEEQEQMVALVEAVDTLLLQAPPGHRWRDRYVVVGDHDRQRIVDKSWVEPTFDTLPWIEVDPPQGAVAAWPS